MPVDDSFQVIYPGHALDQFRLIARRAKHRGALATVEQAAGIIERNLRTDPRSFGDPCYALPSLKLDLFVRAVNPLLVYYGVHRIKNIVMVKRLEALPGFDQ